MAHPMRRRRRRFLAPVAAATLAVLAAGCGGTARPARPPAEPTGATSRAGVSDGALFGGNAALAREEFRLGRTLAIVRVYYRIGQPFPGGSARLMADGSTLLVSLDSDGASYASVAAGNADTLILSFLRAVNQAALRYHLGAIYVSFEHEPESARHRVLGSAAAFIHAWDHVHQLAQAAHLDWNDGGRLHWVWILIHTTFADGAASRYWPGAGEVDVVAADGYDSSGCRAAARRRAGAAAPTTPAGLFNPAVRFALAHGGLPVFITEWGGSAFSPGAQSAFIRRMQAYLAANHEIAAEMYWDSSGARCDYSINGRPAAMSAMSGMARSLPLRGRLRDPASSGKSGS